MREEPYVCVVDLVAHDTGAYGLVKCLLLRFCDFLDYFEIVANVRDVPDPAVMFFRDDLHLSRRVRADVHKSEEFLIFIDFVARNLSSNDFAKNTRLHEGSIQLSKNIAKT